MTDDNLRKLAEKVITTGKTLTDSNTSNAERWPLRLAWLNADSAFLDNIEAKDVLSLLNRLATAECDLNTAKCCIKDANARAAREFDVMVEINETIAKERDTARLERNVAQRQLNMAQIQLTQLTDRIEIMQEVVKTAGEYRSHSRMADQLAYDGHPAAHYEFDLTCKAEVALDTALAIFDKRAKE